jgi:hypothetical protein
VHDGQDPATKASVSILSGFAPSFVTCKEGIY